MILGGFSANPLLTPFAIVLLPLFAALLWRPHEPPVLVFACAMQWLQAAGVILYADSYGVTVSELFGGPQLEWATWLSLIAVATNAFGMKTALLRLPTIPWDRLSSKASRVKIPMAFIAYVICFLIAGAADVLAFTIPSFAQPIYALTTLKWVAIFLLFYSGIQRRSGYGLLFVALLIEFSIGLIGYFSTFKGVFFVLLVAALTGGALRRKQLIVTVIIATVLFVTGIVWSAIKQDYREFLNQGSGLQEVTVSLEDRGAKLSELLGTVSWESFTNGLEALILRVSQVNLFALTLINVPNNVPYEHGALWKDAVMRIVTPRFIFPDKAVVDDSQRANLYTGTQIAGVEAGTSMGIGYVAESYVDFGPVVMFIPTFCLGIFYGLIYRLFALKSRHALLGCSIAVAILVFGAYTIETSNIKLLGINTAAVVVLGSIYLLFGSAIEGWLTGE
ncbi:MAG: hypothetical protein QOI04_1137 [Verrucomicrobiota bacterium]